MPQPDRRRLAQLVLVLMGIGLVAYAAISILHWQKPGTIPDKNKGLMVRKIAMTEAPQSVQEAAAKLALSRVGYAMPVGDATYLIISTGDMGERIEVAGARSTGGLIEVDSRTTGNGERQVVAVLNTRVADQRSIQFNLDGHPAVIPILVNVDDLPLVALPTKGSLALVNPVANARIQGGIVEIAGYARVFEGRFNITVYSDGKGRVLGEAKGVAAAAGAPNWGSFKLTVPVDLSSGATKGYVLVQDEDTGYKLLIPVQFGKK